VLTEAGDYTSKFFKLRQLFSMIIGNYKSKNQNTALPIVFEIRDLFTLALLLEPCDSGWLTGWVLFPKDGREDQRRSGGTLKSVLAFCI